MTAQIVRHDTIRSIAFGSISGSYAAIGTPFGHAMRIIRVVNATQGDMFISFDGVNNNLFLPAGSFVLYDYSTNTEPSVYFQLAKNTQVYCKQSTAPISGAVYVEAIYGFGE